VITTATRDRFDAAAHVIWPLLVARLRRAGASPEDAEDVAQEALLRAWDRNIGFADDGDLLRWCTVVARRSHIDRIRQQARRRDLGDLASEASCRDLEAVEYRHVLGTVNTAMAQLTEQERASLTPSSPHGDRASQVRTAVARHRARGRLRLLVGPFGATGTVAVQMLRTLRRGAPATATAGALAAVALTVTIGHLHVGGPARLPAGHGYGRAPAIGAAPPAGHPGSAPRVRLVSANHPLKVEPQAPPTVRPTGSNKTGGEVSVGPGHPGDHWFCTGGNILPLGNQCVDPPQPAVTPPVRP